MLPDVRALVDDIEATRSAFAGRVAHLTPPQGAFKPDADAWSVADVVEHLVWAEHSGLNKMMVALEAWRRGEPVWSGDHPQREESIEAIVARTWREREVAPPIAEPRMGGPLDYWLAFFASCQSVLEDVAQRIRADELDAVVFPHFLSGPLTLRQRLAFIRFHIRHHAPQIEAIAEAGGFDLEAGERRGGRGSERV